MLGTLVHSPSEVILQLLIDMGLAGNPVDASGLPKTTLPDWPAYDSSEPDGPDNTITVYDTTSRLSGRASPTGYVMEHFGIQIRVRGSSKPVAWTKARNVAVTLDEDFGAYRRTVTIGSSSYLVQSVNRTGGVQRMGKETPTSKRFVYTINVLTQITQAA